MSDAHAAAGPRMATKAAPPRRVGGEANEEAVRDEPAVGLVVTGIGTVGADGFDFRTALGRHGYKYLPAASQYFLAAAKRALAQAGPDALAAVGPEERGAAVGTNSAAVALHHTMDRTVTATGAGDLSPVTAPYFSINLFGSRLATEHDLKGFNLTFTSPRIAGLEALQTGQRALATGRARRLLAGATEETLPEGEPGADTSEAGAVALVLEPEPAARSRGVAVLGRVGVRSFFLPPKVAASAEGAERAAALLRDALDALGHRPDRPLAVTAVLDGSPVGEALAAALDEKALGGWTLAGEPERVPAGAGALEPVARVAVALGAPDGHPHAVVTAAAEGNAAVCLVTPGAAVCLVPPGAQLNAASGAEASAMPDAPAGGEASAGGEQPMSGRRRASDR
ncbi:beta-ketoacyl synthase N-terminal-like domain-containing protein [Streptomyces rapamycinicus]|uniref:3-oxoacyl-ACP synthase n=2 Tax=Streptomyces rapamycinicus TaxID=1226757 RepID=A0A3L8RHM6_STRRN|nr:beta-ketoacyl synthase N-terminal-like domain-containing protein [Streptomyces rapamycinicus]MBB4785222.1 3-oxoacyl-[acyl-carrier-protein] synthase II [Streptomyces rapamycinicus]RLV79306.1 3-oxoacyl-ACP synthase [Streptomyces rapamycinicus NRRL 5491]UTO65432.1 3-oxoacyl-ACP synthase [Streptomyces rapamycinicus]UTP33388.1 3-oxoacyl-ACP synthase [Streptomyces rapamycinicus NRRL 5491]